MEITRETIFFSSIRTFFKSLFGTIAIIIVLIPAIIGIISFSSDKDISNKNRIIFLPDANGDQEILPPSAPVVLQIPIEGVLGGDHLTGEIVRTQLLESRKGFFKKDRVKAILLHINTPGGTVDDSDQIYTLIKEYKEKFKVPVHAYVERICASGGMYVASSCDYISASPVSLVGSVGVLMGPFFNFTEGLNKIGISTHLFTAGKDKDMMNPFRTWTDEDKKSYDKITSYLYNRFVSIVLQARPSINKEDLINKYGAHIFAAPEAKKNGFIDEANFTYNQALEHLLKVANIKTDLPYQVVKLQPKHKWLSELLKENKLLSKGELTHTLKINNQKMTKKHSLFSYLYDPLGQTVSNNAHE